MNRKTEDQILKLAFEEMTPEQAAACERELNDPEASRALADYRRMRADLRMLADVPPDQLSKERLREAILDRGLKPKPLKRQSWAWMPVTAAALAAIVFMVRPHPSVTPRLAMHKGPDLFRVPTLQPPVDRVATNLPETSSMIRTMPVPVMRDLVLPASSRHATRRRHPQIQEANWNVNDPWDNPDLTANTMPPANGKPAAPTKPAGGGAGPAALTPAAPIVLIEAEKDGNTGASRATEVSSSSNVVVGG